MKMRAARAKTAMRTMTYGNPALLFGGRRDTTPLPGFTVGQIPHFAPVLKFLNKKDLDILFLIFIARKKQASIQYILGRTQSSICYDLKRIRQRIRFIAYLLSVQDAFLSFLESPAAKEYSTEELDVIASMFYSTSLTQTAEVLKMPQIKVRYVFDTTIRKMEQLGHWEMYEIFTLIRRNLNIVRRVYCPWGEKW
jgi:hypothetical protein